MTNSALNFLSGAFDKAQMAAIHANKRFHDAQEVSDTLRRAGKPYDVEKAITDDAHRALFAAEKYASDCLCAVQAARRLMEVK